MLVWSGDGYIVPFIGCVLIGVCLLIGSTVGVADEHSLVVGFLVAAVATWIVGRRMNDPSKGRPFIDANTGETIVLRERHTVFWIEAQWWAIPCVVAAFGNHFRDDLFPDGVSPWPTVFTLVGVG